MDTVTHVVGIDPGLVHTGVVRLLFNSSTNVLNIEPRTIIGPDMEEADAFTRQAGLPKPHVFVEEYRPRHSLVTNIAMLAAQKEIVALNRGVVLVSNTGIRHVVKRPLMEALDLWNFQSTHHQDLRSAARIALLGMMKDDHLNALLAQVVRDMLDQRPWELERI